MRILSIGGGVDRVANYLASRGNRVISADISFNAATATRNFDGLSSIPRVHPVVADCQEQCFQNRSFDAVVSKRALHHMDITRVASIVYELLVSGGIFLAEEPICLSPLLRSIHREVPFHPQAIRTEDERELGGDDLQVLGTRFHSMNIRYFDLFARESIAYCLCRLRLDSILLKPLGRLDDFAANQCLPWLRRFCSYAIIECRK